MTQQITLDPVFRRILEGTTRIDESLPTWARRSNPIVRRQLGVYWKTLPLEVGLWARLIVFQSVLVLVAVPLPVLYSFIMPIVTVSILLLPLVLFTYGQVLVNVARAAVTAIMDERQNNTLALLLVTPLPLHHILFSKIAASIWRQLDNLSVIMMGHVLLSLPVLILQYASAYSPDDQPFQTAAAIILALTANLVRLFLEPIMIGAIGLVLGTTTSPRIVGVIVTVTLGAAYFLFLNLPRLLTLSWSARLLLEIALPLILPVLITWCALQMTARLLRQD